GRGHHGGAWRKGSRRRVGRRSTRGRALLGPAPRRREQHTHRPRLAARRGRTGSRDPHPLMPLDFLLEKFQELPATRSLIERLPPPGKHVGVGGLPGSSGAVLVAALARSLPQRVFTVLAATPADGERWL